MLNFNCSAGDKVFNLKEPGRYLEQFLTIQVGNVSGHDYQKFEKGLDARVTYMTCDEYLNKCIDDVFHSTYEKTVEKALDKANIHKYAQLMLQGVQMEGVPYLNYAGNTQEGRHRACAFKEAFGADAKFPVVEIFPSKVTLEEIEAYCYRKFANQDPDHYAPWYMKEIGPRHGYSMREIYEYLGLKYEEPEWETEEEEEEDEGYDDIELDDDLLLDDTESYETVVKRIADKVGMQIDDVENMDDATFAKLVDKLIG